MRTRPNLVEPLPNPKLCMEQASPVNNNRRTKSLQLINAFASLLCCSFEFVSQNGLVLGICPHFVRRPSTNTMSSDPLAYMAWPSYNFNTTTSKTLHHQQKHFLLYPSFTPPGTQPGILKKTKPNSCSHTPPHQTQNILYLDSELVIHLVQHQELQQVSALLHHLTQGQSSV